MSDTRELTEKLTPHEQAMVHLRERCRELHQQLGRDVMLRQGDPVETLFTFAKSLIADREYVIGWNDGFEFATSEKEALKKELTEARKALEPFATAADNDSYSDDEPLTGYWADVLNSGENAVTFGHLRAARCASHAGGGDD